MDIGDLLSDLGETITYTGELVVAVVLERRAVEYGDVMADAIRLLVATSSVALPAEGDSIIYDGTAWTVRVGGGEFTLSGVPNIYWTFWATSDERIIY